MEGEPQQTVLRDALVRFGDDERDGRGAVGGIDAQHATAAALGHPEAAVRAPT